MKSNIAKVISMAVILFAACGTACATWQTHDWTIRVNGTTYGLEEMYDLPNQRTTLLHYGGDTYRVIHAPIYLVSLTSIAVVIVPLLLVVYFYARHRRHQRAA